MDESDPTQRQDERQARWREVQTLMLAVLDEPPQVREAVLRARAGGDPSLVEEVRSLLAAHDDAATILDQPASVLPADPNAVSEGALVGPFRLVELVGRGGMGVVWLAERADQDFTQRVAVKLVKRGMDSEEILGRFLRERRLLARLDHPNIARLLDGGITDQGLPWFAMEYVEGVPLLAYCDGHDLSVDARLELQRKICEAVEHAHRNLIVHRDLKPSNILVTADGEPKLLDFGIAKLLGADDEEVDAPVTRSGMRMMTPHYAAPEQVLGEPVTTATDVYALGVILYELLTGTLPYPETQHVGSKLMHAIVEHDPERPSTIARRATTATVEEARGARSLAGDLDRICLMALRKEPLRRYGSAQAFADDLARYRDGYPVVAQTDSFTYRSRKFIVRNRLGVAASVLVLLSLSVGLAAALWQADVAQREASRAQRIKGFLVEIFEQSRPGEDRGTTLTAQEILNEGAARVEAGFEGEPDLQAELLQVVGELYLSIGLLDDAERLLQRSLGVLEGVSEDRQLLRARGDIELAMVHFERSEYAQAEALGARAVARYRASPGRQLEDYAEALRQHAITLSEISKYEEAEPLHREGLALSRELYGDQAPQVAAALHDYGQHLKWQGRFDEAEPLYREALEIRLLSHGPEHLNVSLTQGNLGVLLGMRGDYAEAEPLLLAAYETDARILGSDHPTTALRLNNLSMFYYVTAAYEAAEPLMRQALALNRQRFGDENERVATNLHNLANVLIGMGRGEEAVALHEEALAVRRRVLEPDHPRLAQSLKSTARVRLAQGRPDDAQAMLVEATSIVEGSLEPSHPIFIDVLIATGELRFAQQRLRQAEETLVRALALAEAHLAEDSRETAQARSLLGRSLAALGRAGEARPLLSAAVQVLERQRGAGDPLTEITREALAAVNDELR